MNEIVDARGLSCPQPVLMTLQRLKSAASPEIAVLVDTATSRENVSRAATSQGWVVKAVEREGDGYRVTIGRA